MRRVGFFVLISKILFHHLIYGQNILKDGGFEARTVCPEGVTTQTYRIPLKHWYSPTKGTPDFFHSCSSGPTSVPRNFAGQSYAHSGEAYIGLCVIKLPDNHYREYISTKLIEPLKAEREYQLKFFHRLSFNSRYSIHSLQVVLSKDSLFSKADTALDIKSDNLRIIFRASQEINEIEWSSFETLFVAKGGEQFLTVGNFNNSKVENYSLVDRRTYSPQMVERVAYYYFDDFEIEENNTTPFQIGKSFYLQNVYFDFNSYEVKEQAKVEAEKLALFLRKNPKSDLIINGHTDTVGEKEYNQRLSYKRAEAIQELIVSYGIPESRIFIKGLGMGFPTGSTDSLDRRVEFILTESQE